MESGAILNTQITASSEADVGGSERSRLNMQSTSGVLTSVYNYSFMCTILIINRILNNL